MIRLTILGSTGSIGVQALDVARNHPDRIRVAALTCQENIDLLEAQAVEFGVRTVAVANRVKAKDLRARFSGVVMEGPEGIEEIAAAIDADIVLNALVGSPGIRPTAAAIAAGRDIALANKETLVAAGGPIMAMARSNGVAIRPVDSEHSAVFQCIHRENPQAVRRVILTCSGGPFRGRGKDDLASVTVDQALSHPRWRMGSKISIDSATLMNKGFEVIEAHVMFDVPYDRIEVLVHPQSIVHSLVEFADHSILAHLGVPDMRVPIQYALLYPDRVDTGVAPLRLEETGRLDFDPPDMNTFPCLGYAYEAGREGGSMPCVLNAANEAAVYAFLQGAISFNDIPSTIRRAMDEHCAVADPSLEEIIDIDARVQQDLRQRLGIWAA